MNNDSSRLNFGVTSFDNLSENFFLSHRESIKKSRHISHSIGKCPDLSRLPHAKLKQLLRSIPIDRVETPKTVVETTGFELAPIVW